MNSVDIAPIRVTVDGTVRHVGAKARLTLGRTPENDIVVNHHLVSRQHLSIEWRNGQWYIADLGSTNGSFAGPTRLTEIPAGNGTQTVRLGDPNTGPLVEVVPATAPSAAPTATSGPPPGAVTLIPPVSQPLGAQPPQPGPPVSHPLPAQPGPSAPPQQGRAGSGPQPNQGQNPNQFGGQPQQRPFAPQQQPHQPQQPQSRQFGPGPSGGTMPTVDFGPRQPIVRPPNLPDSDAAPHLQSLLHNVGNALTAPEQAGRQAISLVGTQTIGRTPDNDIVVSDVLASRHHAKVTKTSAGMFIDDLRSVNGTYVNGRRVARQQLTDGDVVTIGNSDFVVSQGNLMRGQAQSVVAGGLEVHGVGLTVDGKELLRNINFSAAPGSLTAIIGPSGAGKSTAAKIIAGLSRPSAGVVQFEGRNVHAEYDALASRIGMVPQDDVLHRKLTLRQALGYAAQLRLPPDMNKADRSQVVAGVLAELQLLDHLDTRVDKLSGGQRKRASVAMELLTGPSLLILDEPTSGLDPALDRQVMNTLRRLADAGRVVIVVTHSLSYLSLCDEVLLLAPGGKTAFCGAPNQVGSAMGTTDWAEIFAYVAEQPDAAHARYTSRFASQPAPPPPPTPGPVVKAKQSGFLRQLSTVARRQVRLIFADTGYLAFLVLLPIVLGALSLVIPGSAGYQPNNVDEPAETVQMLVVLVIGAAFMGTALSVRDLVGERPIYERERAVGLRPAAYLWAKVVVFFVAVALQTALMLAINFVRKGTPTAHFFLPGWLELFAIVAWLGCVSTLVGLAISAAVRSTEQTMPPLVIVIMVQFVFSGGLFALAGRPGLEQLSWIFPSRWGYAGAAAVVDLREVSQDAQSVKVEKLWTHDLMYLGVSYGVLALMGLVLFVFTWRRLVIKK
ncbi:FHA domain-containing protein [Gordonia sp. TBRC 11910]|uniref:FHA domain-containing protein n=1 Tax=Gordonia asplenii TaxID=2725283 RepID=A0A848L407_9ACTN|nr:FHA domain-containing protein [Gordonia asplenii]NMO05162.1 FHA domain-containing protein [Gordonia asplenii]